MGTPKVCSLLHGVFMGVYLFEMLTLCSPKFQGRYYRFPSFVPRVPPFVTGFSTNFLSLYLKKSQYCVFFRCCNPESFGCFPGKFVCFPGLFSCFPHMQSGKFGVFSGHICGLSGLTLCFLVSLPFLLEKIFIIKRRRLAAPYLVGIFFQNEMQKIKSPPRPRPLADLPFLAQIFVLKNGQKRYKC